jgi:hypothetical protein
LLPRSTTVPESILGRPQVDVRGDNRLARAMEGGVYGKQSDGPLVGGAEWYGGQRLSGEQVARIVAVARKYPEASCEQIAGCFHVRVEGVMGSVYTVSPDAVKAVLEKQLGEQVFGGKRIRAPEMSLIGALAMKYPAASGAEIAMAVAGESDSEPVAEAVAAFRSRRSDQFS